MQGEVGWKSEVLKTPFQGTFGNSTSTQGTEQSLRKGGFDRLPERIGWGRWCGSPAVSGVWTCLLWQLPFGLLPSSGA